MVTAQARSFYLKPETQSWPAGDEQHALIALQYMTRGFGNRSEYPRLLERLLQRWPLDKHPRVAAAYKRLLPKIEEKRMTARRNPDPSRVGLHLLVDRGSKRQGEEPVLSVVVAVPNHPILTDWSRAARELNGYLRAAAHHINKNVLIYAVTHSGKHIELSRSDVNLMAQGLSDKALANPALIPDTPLEITTREERSDVNCRMPLAPGLSLVSQITRTGGRAWVTHSEQRPFIMVSDSQGRVALMYQSFSGTGGKQQGQWFFSGGVLASPSGRALWIIKGHPKTDPGEGRAALLDIYERVNAVLPHTDADTDAFIARMTADAPVNDFFFDDRYEIAASLKLHEKGAPADLMAKWGAWLHAFWEKNGLTRIWGPRDLGPAKTNRGRAKANRGGAAGSDEAQIEANRREVEEMLKHPPGDWRVQFQSGGSQLRQTGQPSTKELTREGALRVLGITAGGNRSSDKARGSRRVPADVREEAMHGLRLSHANNYGAWNFIGIARAIQLATEPGVPTSTVDRMSNYFTRHAKDKRSANFGNERSPSRGYMAWLNWGGDAGQRWVSGADGKG